MQDISIDYTMFSPSIVTHRDVDVIFKALYNHLVPTDVYLVRDPQPWSIVYNYIYWFYRVQCAYMTFDVVGEPDRTTRQDILEDKHARADHVVYVLPICQSIIAIV